MKIRIFFVISIVIGEQKWSLIGDVVTNNDTVSSAKGVHDGKKYDYVFDIDIGDGIPPLKLPYNNNQDPYHVAQVMFIIFIL